MSFGVGEQIKVAVASVEEVLQALAPRCSCSAFGTEEKSIARPTSRDLSLASYYVQ